ncbi:hypothetical protein [Desulfallas thermosapovorans]|uniref:Uncharacterized protein n=1 Tax=Desulfallas thermosapovorans DSM 6562 TaxID=1121431 RepID=A0A5S4ZP20_9FIRM|nr:hypothetical protein [Desulfallas thermosapovorans]TYO93803.1 hypothetical protein LX24_02603 [Desulfallas thermosapovorans DSM 6562]
MQISGVLPILLNIILSEQQNQKQTPREPVANKTIPRPSSLFTSTPETEATPRQRQAEGGEPLLLPLPVKTSLYPDTQFFVFRKTGDPGHKQYREETGIVFSLATMSLGQLFFVLTQRGNTAIHIACRVENESIAARLTTAAEELKRQVQQLGFAQITFHCAVLDQKLRKLRAEFASPALLDRKV